MNPSAAMDPHPAPGAELPDVESARRRWRSAAETLFPTLVADPPSYARALETIGAMARELGARRADLTALAAAMADPDALIAGCGQRPYGAVPPVLLVGVACGMRERDLIAEKVRRDHLSALERCRTTGTTWAVLNDPECIEDVTGGSSGVASCTHLHVPSGVELRATVDAWSSEPYRIDVIAPGVVPPQGRSFARRGPWIEEFRRCRREIGESP